METFLLIIQGVGWTLVYLAILYSLLKHKTCPIPYLALILNCIWEILYTIDGMINGTFVKVQLIIHYVWAVLDTVIISLYFLNNLHLTSLKKKGSSIAYTILSTIFGILYHAFFYLGIKGFLAAEYSAYLSNLIMSAVFIAALYSDAIKKEQSVFIGLCKLVGTFSVGIVNGWINNNISIKVCVVIILILDLMYLSILIKRKAKKG